MHQDYSFLDINYDYRRSWMVLGVSWCVVQLEFSRTHAGFNPNSGVVEFAYWLWLVMWWGALQGYRSIPTDTLTSSTTRLLR